MKCFHPVPVNIVIGKREFKSVPVPCGKCEACLSRRAFEWQCRLREEMKDAQSAYFVTLTYEDEKLPIRKFDFEDHFTGEVYQCSAPMVEPRDVQLFLKRLRKRISPLKIRYYLVSEYGPKNFRPHYHMILFDLPKYINPYKTLEETWKNGFIKLAPVTMGRIAYVTKYCFGTTIVPDYLRKNFTRMSLKPAIGSNLLPALRRQLDEKSIDELRYFANGTHYPLPKYYRKKLEKEYGLDLAPGQTEEEFKIARMEEYVASRYWEDAEGILESQERLEAIRNGDSWYQTNSELKKERFLKNFYKKYYKTRTLNDF